VFFFVHQTVAICRLSDAGALEQEHAEVLLKAVCVALQFVFNFTTACTAAQQQVWRTQFPDGLMQTVQVCLNLTVCDSGECSCYVLTCIEWKH
jgi:hypothetical protein